MGFSGGSEGKETACNAADLSSIPGLGRFPWRRDWLPTPIFLPERSHKQGSLAGYSPWVAKSWTQLSNQCTNTLQDNNVSFVVCCLSVKCKTQICEKLYLSSSLMYPSDKNMFGIGEHHFWIDLGAIDYSIDNKLGCLQLDLVISN